MKHFNMLGREPGCWSRIMARVKASRSHTQDAEAQALRSAYLAMEAEQRAEGLAAGFVMCDVPWCGHEASHVWTRTAAQIKASTVKVKKVKLQMESTSIRREDVMTKNGISIRDVTIKATGQRAALYIKYALGVQRFSFDAGNTWSSKVLVAYEQAIRNGRLAIR